MKGGMKQGEKGLAMAGKQFARVAKQGCAVPEEASAALATMKAKMQEVASATAENIEDVMSSMMDMGESGNTMQEGMHAAEACANLKPMQKQATSVAKQLNGQCTKIANAAKRNEALADLVSECNTFLATAQQQLAEADKAAKEDPESARDLYAAFFDAREEVNALQMKQMLSMQKGYRQRGIVTSAWIAIKPRKRILVEI